MSEPRLQTLTIGRASAYVATAALLFAALGSRGDATTIKLVFGGCFAGVAIARYRDVIAWRRSQGLEAGAERKLLESFRAIGVASILFGLSHLAFFAGLLCFDTGDPVTGVVMGLGLSVLVASSLKRRLWLPAADGQPREGLLKLWPVAVTLAMVVERVAWGLGAKTLAAGTRLACDVLLRAEGSWRPLRPALLGCVAVLAFLRYRQVIDWRGRLGLGAGRGRKTLETLHAAVFAALLVGLPSYVFAVGFSVLQIVALVSRAPRGKIGWSPPFGWPATLALVPAIVVLAALTRALRRPQATAWRRREWYLLVGAVLTLTGLLVWSGRQPAPLPPPSFAPPGR